MDMDPCPPVSGLKRAFFCLLVLLILGGIGAYTTLTATNPKIPQAWGDIRLAHYSTNETKTLAHFRFQNKFEWPVMVEVGMEVNDGRTWEVARGYLLFSPIEKPVLPRSFASFSVPVPFESKEWRVLVRAAKAHLTKTDMFRDSAKRWLETHGVAFLGQKIEVQDPNGYIMPGPLMKFDKAGRLPTPYY